MSSENKIKYYDLKNQKPTITSNYNMQSTLKTFTKTR